MEPLEPFHLLPGMPMVRCCGSQPGGSSNHSTVTTGPGGSTVGDAGEMQTSVQNLNMNERGSIISNSYKQPRGSWINDMWSIHTTRCPSTAERSGVRTHAARVTLESMLLSERSQTHEATVCDSTDVKCPEQAPPQTESRAASPGTGGKLG